MQWLVYILGGLAALVVLLLGIGYALPKHHVAARRLTIARPVGEVWQLITEVERYPAWRRGVTKVERSSPRAFRETSSHGVIAYEVDEEQTNTRRITRIADPSLPFGGRWIYELATDRSGTRLTITEDGFISNPLFRLLSRTVFSTTSTMEGYLADVRAQLGGAGEIEAASPATGY